MAMTKNIPSRIYGRESILCFFLNLYTFLKQITNRYLSVKTLFTKRKGLAFTAGSFIFLLTMLPQKTFANVTITAPSLTVYACGGTFPTSYYTLGSIVITEGSQNDFPNTGAVQKTLILSAPTNFQFNPGFGSTTAAGGNVSIVSTAVTAGTITITYTCNAVNKTDVLTISNIQVRGITAVATQTVTRTGGTGTIAGDVNTTIHANLTSSTQTLPSITTSSSQQSCSGSATSIALTTSPSGSSFTWTLGTVTNISGATACASSCGTTIAQTLNVSSGNSGSVQYNVTPTLNGCAGTIYTITNTVYALPSGGSYSLVREGGRCGVRLDGTTETCPNGSTPTYQWYYRQFNGDPWTILSGETNEDLLPSNTDATKYRYRREVICGSCSADYFKSQPVGAYMSLTAVGTGSCTVGQLGTQGTATVTVTGGTAPFTYSSDGVTFQSSNVLTNLTAGTYTITVKDAAGPPACNANTSITIAGLTGTAGVWTGLVGTDWFDCANWGSGTVPPSASPISVSIPATTNSPIIDLTSSYASAFSYAPCQNITITSNTLSFASSGKLLATGNVTISSGGNINMTSGGTLELQGNWVNNVGTSGFTSGAGKVVFSGSSSPQTITTTSGSTETFYDLQINKTSTTDRVHLKNSITASHNLTLTSGIFVTESNLFTWNNTGGILTAPQPSYVNTTLDYTKSFIATCDATGTPISVADATTAFGGNAGFKIKNIGNTDTYFPVGASYIPADNTYPVPAPNRMMINNQSGTSQDYTVVVNYGDIGYTDGTANTWKVNRIWYVKADNPVLTAGQATMKLFFTKRDWLGWGSDENEVEAGFNYTQTALVQKDYGPDRGDFINLSSGGDIQDFSQILWYPYNTEIYGAYTINVSNSLTNGIAQFNRFSVVNPGDIILPVSLTNLKAYQKGNAIQIEWTALNELNIGRYEVEKSANGFSFATAANMPARNNGNAQNNYAVLDTKPLQGDNFYRIKAIDKNGAVYYTAIIAVNINGGKTSVTVMPNPVPNKMVNLQLNNLTAGKYNVVLYNSAGQKVFNKTIEHSGGSASQSLTFPSGIAKGIYVLKVFNQIFDYNTKIVIE